MEKRCVLWILLPILSYVSEVGLADWLSIDVLCDLSGMHVHVRFEEPFEGVVYSKGYLNDSRCRYLPPQGMAPSFTFHIPRSLCGTETSSLGSAVNHTNTVVFQNNQILETSMDYIRKLSCDFHSLIKQVTPEDTIPISENPIRTWMEIKRLSDPLSGSEPVKNVKVGDGMMVIIYVSKPKNNDSVRIVNCDAHDEPTKEKGTAVKLLDHSGCPLQPQIFSGFEFIKKNFGGFLVAISHMTAFKFREKEKLYITCGIDVSCDNCSNTCVNSSAYEPHSNASKNETSKRYFTVLDTFATRDTEGESDQRKKTFDEFTARRLMKAIVALSSKLKPGRRRGRLDSGVDNSSLLKRRYGGLENVTEKQTSSTATMSLLELRNNSKYKTLPSTNKNKNLYLPHKDSKSSEQHGTIRHHEFSKRHEVDVQITTRTSSKLNENGTFFFRKNEASPRNMTVTKGLSILPADVVMNIDSPYLNEYEPYCFSYIKFTVITSCLLLLVFCLLVACILLTLNIRTINRRNSISRFLFYPYN